MSKIGAKFDDLELEDIMREMEEIDQSQQSQEHGSLGVADTHGRSHRKIHHPWLSESKEAPPLSESVVEEKVNKKSTMDFNLSGQMDLRFRFNAYGHKIAMTIRDGKNLEIETGDGAKFVLPLTSVPKKKIA